MEVRPVSLSKEQLHTVLPQRIYDLVELPDTHVFAALEDNVMLGIAVAATSTNDKFIIYHLSLVGSDDEAVLSEILKYIEEICKKAGNLSLVCRLSGDDEYMDMCDRLLPALSYQMTYDKGHHIEYNLKTIKDTLFFSQLKKLEFMMSKVKCYNELDMLQLAQFHEKLKKTRIVTENYTPDLVFAQYYVDNDNIKGFMDFKEVDEGVLLLIDSYVETDVNNKYVAPAMIASAIKVTNSFLGDDSKLILQTFTNGMYAGIVACFGEAMVDEPIREYTKTP